MLLQAVRYTRSLGLAMTNEFLLASLGVMFAATYLTRFGGMFAMRYVPLTPFVKRFLTGMANTVLVAVVAPIVVQGDPAIWVGALGACAVFMKTRQAMFGVLAGVVVTVLVRVLSA